MGFFENGFERGAALCVGTVALAFGQPPAGFLEASVGAAGLVGFVLGRRQKFGPECARVRIGLQSRVSDTYRHVLTGSDGDPETRANLDQANDALLECLEGCVIDRARLAEAAVSPAGFADQAVMVVMDGLAELRPELFGGDRAITIGYRFARDVVRIGLEEAIRNPDYYRTLEPALMFEMASALGQVREDTGAIREDTSATRAGVDDLGRKIEDVQQSLARLVGGTQQRDALLTAKEQDLQATRADLLALLEGILEQRIPAEQVGAALDQAHARLRDIRSELETLRGLANEVPDIAPDLSATLEALETGGTIDLHKAQAALGRARLEYTRQVPERRRQEALNLSRFAESEADLAAARSRYLEAADLYAKAAEGLPGSELARRGDMLVASGDMLRLHGEIFPEIGSLQCAVAAYDAALEVRTRDPVPVEWARIQSRRAGALLILGHRTVGAEGRALLEGALCGYDAALEVRTRDALPVDWAATQNDRANALQRLGQRTEGDGGRALLEQALSGYDAALEVRTRDAQPFAWAGIQNNRANVLKALGTRTGGETRGLLEQAAAAAERLALLEQAVATYDAVLEVYTCDALPIDWARTQFNRANALSALGRRFVGADFRALLTRAVAGYDAALEVHTRNTLPRDWARTQRSRATALVTLGERTVGAEGRGLLHQAVAGFDAALKVHTRAGLPLDWASTQLLRARAMALLGKRTIAAEGRALLQQAVAGFDAALKVHTRASMPVDWALTQALLAGALQSLGARAGEAETRSLLEQAVARYEAALEVLTVEAFPGHWNELQAKLDRARQSLRDPPPDKLKAAPFQGPSDAPGA